MTFMNDPTIIAAIITGAVTLVAAIVTVVITTRANRKSDREAIEHHRESLAAKNRLARFPQFQSAHLAFLEALDLKSRPTQDWTAAAELRAKGREDRKSDFDGLLSQIQLSSDQDTSIAAENAVRALVRALDAAAIAGAPAESQGPDAQAMNRDLAIATLSEFQLAKDVYLRRANEELRGDSAV